MKTAAYGLTDVGRCRETNQDQLLVDPGIGLYAVADGMGGHAAGEVASELAIRNLGAVMRETLSDDGRPEPEQAALSLEQALKQSNAEIYQSHLTRVEWRGMGTTIVAMLALDDRAVIGHVGDSRAYRLRDGRLERLTSDHSWVNEQVKLGLLTDEEAHRHPMRNIVTRALGNRPETQVELSHETVRAGDLFLLCSDGLNSMLDDETIRDTLVEHAEDPEAACRALVTAANQRGGEDNITVVVLRADP